MKIKISIFILLITLLSFNLYSDNIKLFLNRSYAKSLITHLQNAKKEVIISSFMWCCYPEKYRSLPCNVLDKVIHLVKKGLKVTIILEKDKKSDSKCNEVVAKIFQHTLLKKYNNFKLYFDSPYVRSHQKIVLIDGKFVFLGSHNITQSALKYNNEVSVLIESKKIYKKLKRYLNKIILTSEKVY